MTAAPLHRRREPVSAGGLATASLRAAALALLLLPVAPTSAAGQEASDFALSDPATHTWRFAELDRRSTARAKPASRARAVARIETRTPEGTPMLLPLVKRRAVGGRLWIKVRLPVLPNGTTGWLPRGRLGGYETVRTRLIVNRRRLTARLERRGRTVFRARVGIGESRWPTPRGTFIVRNRLAGFDDPAYGVLAFGTSARSAVLTDWPGGGFIGIHGTSAPHLLPGRVSHGCIRMRNADILRLDRRMPLGTPVTVR